MKCKRCGQLMPGTETTLEELMEVDMTIQQSRMLRALGRVFPRKMGRDQLIEKVWPNEAGRPETVNKAISTQLWGIRKIIEPLGWTISRVGPSYGSMAEYGLKIRGQK